MFFFNDKEIPYKFLGIPYKSLSLKNPTSQIDHPPPQPQVGLGLISIGSNSWCKEKVL